MKLLLSSLVLLALGLGCADERRDSTQGIAGTSLTEVAPAELGAGAEVREAQGPKTLAGLPNYPGSEVVGPAGEGTALSLTSGDSPKQVFEFYRERLREAGWTIDGQHREGAEQHLTASKGARLALVDLQGDGHKTHIEILFLDP